MRSVILAAPGSETMAQALGERLDTEMGDCRVKHFPDGECHVRIHTPLKGCQAVIVSSLNNPSQKLIPLLFLAATARDLGAERVGLVAPYLAFMRQDERFDAGEGVSAVYFAKIISRAVDWLVTVDPHLHRLRSLDQIYSIPSRTAHAAPSIAEWIRAQVPEPVLIGPDEESAQWVSAVAGVADAPYMVLKKVRRGDRDVEVSIPDPALCRGRTPVIIDDIISTARTMMEPVGHLISAGLPPPVCIGVHAVFADNAYGDLQAAGAAHVITCNTIPHRSNAIYVDSALAEAMSEFIS